MRNPVWDLPISRPMPRTPRRIHPNVPNHIVTRGNNRRRLFSYPRDYLAFLRLIGHAIRGTKCRLHAACLMTNHVHLLLTPPTIKAASDCVKRFSQRYAQIRNEQRDSSGKLFEQRYFSEPILDERQLAMTTMYIEANPVRAGLVDNALNYRWSTHAVHRYQLQSKAACAFSDLWTPSAWYQKLGSTAVDRADGYRSLFDEYLRAGEEPAHAPLVARLEELSAEPYQRKLRRPDGTRASESAGGGFGRLA